MGGVATQFWCHDMVGLMGGVATQSWCRDRVGLVGDVTTSVRPSCMKERPAHDIRVLLQQRILYRNRIYNVFCRDRLLKDSCRDRVFLSQ